MLSASFMLVMQAETKSPASKVRVSHTCASRIRIDNLEAGEVAFSLETRTAAFWVTIGSIPAICFVLAVKICVDLDVRGFCGMLKETYQ